MTSESQVGYYIKLALRAGWLWFAFRALADAVALVPWLAR